ncbi:hypothetical protein J23TS9_28910 [Paenibacillus sp. J23TS9]|nr:hypothetical protein J23TS9_28910 [Paenibacillus sp. J23TS9]
MELKYTCIKDYTAPIIEIWHDIAYKSLKFSLQQVKGSEYDGKPEKNMEPFEFDP